MFEPAVKQCSAHCSGLLLRWIQTARTVRYSGILVEVAGPGFNRTVDAVDESSTVIENGVIRQTDS